MDDFNTKNMTVKSREIWDKVHVSLPAVFYMDEKGVIRYRIKYAGCIQLEPLIVGDIDNGQ